MNRWHAHPYEDDGPPFSDAEILRELWRVLPKGAIVVLIALPIIALLFFALGVPVDPNPEMGR